MDHDTAHVTITALPAFTDNYIWVIRRGPHCAVVDPGDAAPAQRYLLDSEAELVAVLLTHHHADHCGGALAVRDYAGPATPVYAPAGEAIQGVSHPLSDGAQIALPGLELSFEVLGVPGHTAHHIAYYNPALRALFCGDTLFGAGCGRLFEGTAAQMQASLARLAALPGDTRVYCAHEYTAANLRFAHAVEPDNAAIAARQTEVAALRAEGRYSVPSSIAVELATNPFLRWDEPAVRAAAMQWLGHEPADAVATFAAIRAWKNEFR